MSERCERTSERRSEWPSTLRVGFIVILPTGTGIMKSFMVSESGSSTVVGEDALCIGLT